MAESSYKKPVEQSIRVEKMYIYTVIQKRIIMKISHLAFCAVTVTISPFAQGQENILFYREPAKIWTEALPVGNGRIGGMVFGGVAEERIGLNEATLWSGGPVPESVNPEAASYLPALRKAAMEEDYPEADRLARKMQGVWSESYLPLGDLLIRQELGGHVVSGYRRELNIRDAVARTFYTANGVEYMREVFASAPDQVLVVKWTCN
jgi:alpha-L-fucosidase 2